MLLTVILPDDDVVTSSAKVRAPAEDVTASDPAVVVHAPVKVESPIEVIEHRSDAMVAALIDNVPALDIALVPTKRSAPTTVI